MIENLIRKIAQYLDNEHIPYIIIGGQAVLIYGTPRLTRDIDITLGVDTDKLLLIEKMCKKLKLKVLVKKVKEFAKETNVIPAEESQSRIRVDLIFSYSNYEQQAMTRAKRVDVAGYPVKFAAVEDVIIHKMVAGRAIDQEDIKNIILKQRNKIDVIYIRKWLAEFEQLPQLKDIAATFDRLLKNAVVGRRF